MGTESVTLNFTFTMNDQKVFRYLGQVFDDPPRFGGDSGGEGGLLGVAGGRRRLERHVEPRAVVPSARFMNMYDPKYDPNRTENSCCKAS